MAFDGENIYFQGKYYYKSLEFDAIELHVKASQSSEHPSAPVAAGAGVS